MSPKITQVSDNLYYDERSAGGIVYKIVDHQVYWLLIKTIKAVQFRQNDRNNHRSAKSVYKFPKGHLQEGEFLKDAALREVEEEGRVKAKIISKIGSRDYVLWDKIARQKIIKKVTFFLMKYLSDSDKKYYDHETVISRDWFTYDEAISKLAYDSEKVLLKKAASRLKFLK